MKKHTTMQKNRTTRSLKHFSHLSAFAVLAMMCTGCHYDSNPPIDETREANLQADIDIINGGIPEFSAPLTLEEIYCIAQKRNINVLVKALEYDIQSELVTRERFGMLPDIKTHFDRLIRNRNTASFSESLVPGVPPAPLSISSQKHQRRWDYAVVWNYVDFGLAFLRSRQEFNKAVKLQFEYQRLQQNLFVDITRQYWKAQTAKLARRKSKIILEKTRTQQAAIQKQLEAKIISEIQGLRNEGQLITYQAQFQFYDKEYHSALSELKLLMGLPPCTEIELADIVTFGTDACLPDICELESLALYSRPELYADDAEELIQRDEARVAVLQMYPGFDLFAGHNYDSNRFLLFNHWIQAGVRAAYNLLDWPRHLQESRAAGGRILLAKNNRILMSVSVMTQVHLAYTIYLDNLESYRLTRALEDVNKRLVKAARSEQEQGKLHEADVLKYEIEYLESQIDALKQYGEVQNSLEQLNNALGLPQQYTTTREYGVLEEEKAVSVQKEIPKEEDKDLDADELRNLYLDYIIEQLEKEDGLSHPKTTALGDNQSSASSFDDLSKEEYEELSELFGVLEFNPTVEISSVDDILRKYRNTAESENNQTKRDEDIAAVLEKYGIVDEPEEQSKEPVQTQKEIPQSEVNGDQHEKPSKAPEKEGIVSRSFHFVVDSINDLYTRVKSLF